MNKFIPVYAYGVLLVFSGVFLILSAAYTFGMVKWTLGVTISLGAVVAFIAAFTRKRSQVQFAYHEMHALAMLVYGLTVLLYCKSFDELISVSVFLFFFYAFSEIIFCNWLFNLAKKVVIRIVVVRLFLGLAVGVGTIVALNDKEYSIQLFGLLFLMVVVNIMLYVPVMKQTNEVSN